MTFTCSKLRQATKEQILNVLGASKIEPLARKDGAPLSQELPTQLVESASWEDWIDWIDEYKEEVRFLDFGESFLRGEEPERLAQPTGLQAPETLFTENFDYRVDLWRKSDAW